jgi:metal-dependent amidase/aminoacylase/carboxypeptidase family protein
MDIDQIKSLNEKLDSSIDDLLTELEEIYKDIHQNPELSMEEVRTAAIAADYLNKYQFEVTTEVSNAPREPEFTELVSYPLTENDVEATKKVAEAFHAQFGNKAFEAKPATASEDFSLFGRNWGIPYVFWFVGGTDPEIYNNAVKNNQLSKIPGNHSSQFAPVLHPTLKTGLQAMITAAAVWLS